MPPLKSLAESAPVV